MAVALRGFFQVSQSYPDIGRSLLVLHVDDDPMNLRVVEEILSAFPDLEREDIRQALRYAAEAVRERQIPLLVA